MSHIKLISTSFKEVIEKYTHINIINQKKPYRDRLSIKAKEITTKKFNKFNLQHKFPYFMNKM